MAAHPHGMPLPPFLGLPREIRDDIFSYVLHPAAFRKSLPEDYFEYKYDLRLLRVNRQIHHEALDVFRRLNTFVRIETPWPEAKQHICREGRVPLIAVDTQAADFNNVHLRVYIQAFEYYVYSESQRYHFVLLLDDLPAFCRMWYYSDLSHPGLNSNLRLTLTVQDPYALDGEEPNIPKALQRKLLEPFGEVKGVNKTDIEGKHDESVEKALRHAQGVPYKTPEECLEEATKLKDEGNAALKKQQYKEAIQFYTRAFLAIHIVVYPHRRAIWGNAYFEMLLRSGEYESQHAQVVRLNLRVKLVANTTLAYLKMENYQEAKFWGMRSINLMREGMGLDEDDEEEAMLAFSAANEMGKIYYRTGLACKAMEETDQARRLLRIAALYLPNDPLVARDLASVALRI